MREERMLVLRMLEEGKITVEEAAELLGALDVTVVEEEGKNDGLDRGIKRVEEMAERLGELGETFSEGMEEKIHKLAEKVDREGERGGRRLTSLLSRLSETGLAGFLGFMGGPKHEFTEEIEGEFTAEGTVTLDLRTVNGRISVQGTDDPTYRLRMVKTIQHEDEEKAKEIASQLMEVEKDGDALRVRLSGQPLRNQHGVALHLTVPRSARYTMEVHSCNGSIELKDLEATSVVAKTANGRIQIDNISSTDMTLKTANGRIEIEGDGQNVEARTSNGRIVLRPAVGSGQYRLKTSNGSIHVHLQPDAECGYNVEASTHNAKIVTDLPEMEFSVDQRSSLGRKRVVAQTRDWDAKDKKVRIHAETTNGRVYIGEGEEQA